jgi:hypothetical protein
MLLATNATLAESPIDIFLWYFPLNSRIPDGDELTSRPVASAPPRSCAAGYPAVDNELRTRHIVGRVSGEEHPVGDILRLPGPAERYPGFGHLVRINRRIAPGGGW